jgi:ATP adenylyltransferase
MSLEQLWNGWRAQYVGQKEGQSPDPSTSVFTHILESGLTDEDAYIVHRSTHCFVILNAYPYASGHLLVLPYREIPNLEDLSTEESLDLWKCVTNATVALRSSHSPDALNVGINLGAAAGGSIARHLHVHVVPRWNGDSNFMTSVADTRTIPEPLSLTASKVRAAWPKGDK